MGHRWIDESTAPLYVINVVGDTEAEQEAMMLAFEQIYAARREPFAIVVDTRFAAPPSARMRQKTAEHEKRVAEFKSRYCRGMAFVMTSALARGALQALWWLHAPAYQHRVFADRHSALAWAHGRLAVAAVA